MKRSILFVALTAIGATSAMAQSNVTVYGRINMSVESQKNATTNDSATVVQNSASRLGFKGTEDLGSGLKASFLLEHGLDPDTGAASGAFWGRESWVALEGGFGKVRLGNMGPTAAYFATADYISMHNHDTGTSADAFYLYPGAATNMIAYTSPSIGGLVVEAQLGLKEAGDKNTVVLAANYDAGPLHIGAGYVNGVSFFAGDEAKQFAVRGAYEMGPITVGAYYAHDDITAPGVAWERDSYRVSAMYTMGAIELHANFGVASEADNTGTTVVATGEAKQFTLGYNYNFSKRTKIYAFYTKISGDGTADYAGWVSGANAESAIALGIRHNF